MANATELPIDTNANAAAMAELILGPDAELLSASFTGDRSASGTFSDAYSVTPGLAPSNSGVILSTGYARDLTNNVGAANVSPDTSTDLRGGVDGDPDFDNLAGTDTFDASWLDMDFVPDNDEIILRFVFASEEYPDYAISDFQDIVGIWVNGSPANLDIGAPRPVNINSETNQDLYVDNSDGDYNTEMDGFTLTLSLRIDVNAGDVNSLRIGIADLGDSAYDSSILIASGLVEPTIVMTEDDVLIIRDETDVFDVLANDSSSVGDLTITHINGTAVVAGDTVTLSTGQSITLTADQTLSVTADHDVEEVSFTYTVDNGNDQETSLVTLGTIPCFVAGTLIETDVGNQPIETLMPGAMIRTHDNGFQPLRWIGRRVVPAQDHLAPIHIAANTFGQHAALTVSPQHRILIRDVVAELLFGEPEVLVAAKHLVNDRSVRRLQGGMVEYVHVLFDQHEVIYSEGLPTESLLPGPEATKGMAAEAVTEILALFPELDPATGAGYSGAVRRTLRSFEAAVLVAPDTVVKPASALASSLTNASVPAANAAMAA